MGVSEFTKHDDGKPRADLLPPKATIEVARVLGHGAKKYGADNWCKASPHEGQRRYIAAALRHTLAILDGEDVDPESGLLHAAHAVASMMFVAEYRLRDACADGAKCPGDTAPPDVTRSDGRCQSWWRPSNGEVVRCAFPAGHDGIHEASDGMGNRWWRDAYGKDGPLCKAWRGVGTTWSRLCTKATGHDGPHECMDGSTWHNKEGE